jgi:cation diffusion facilitator family transporter
MMKETNPKPTDQEPADEERIRLIRRASLIGLFGNAALAAVKLAAGIVSGSLAVLGDAIDTSTDVLVSIVTLVATRIISKPPDREHPYGHGRAETIATKVLSFVILFAGIQLAWSTVLRLIRGGPVESPSILAVQVTAVSIAAKLLLAASQRRVGKKTGSAMLIANGRNMQNDVLISTGVLAGLAFTFLADLPVMDTVTALAVSGLILRTGWNIFIETSTELMDGVSDSKIYPAVFEAVSSVEGVINPHRTRVRRLANLYIVDMDIEVDGSLTVLEGHRLAAKVEKQVKRCVDNVYDVIIHIEPIGNVEKEERYGLSDDRHPIESNPRKPRE